MDEAHAARSARERHQTGPVRLADRLVNGALGEGVIGPGLLKLRVTV